MWLDTFIFSGAALSWIPSPGIDTTLSTILMSETPLNIKTPCVASHNRTCSWLWHVLCSLFLYCYLLIPGYLQQTVVHQGVRKGAFLHPISCTSAAFGHFCCPFVSCTWYGDMYFVLCLLVNSLSLSRKGRAAIFCKVKLMLHFLVINKLKLSKWLLDIFQLVLCDFLYP